MKLIQDNPYRIAGILASATISEFERQKAKIILRAKLGKQAESDYDFSFLNNINRTDSEKVKKAFEAIEQKDGKVRHSIFWFVKANSFDETALDYLKQGNIEKALEFWKKKTDGKEVTSENFSCFNNLGTLKLLSDSLDEIKEGIEAKIKLIESSSFVDFVLLVADQTYTIENQKQVEKFIDDILKQIKGKFSSLETLKLFSSCNSTTQKYLSQRFTEEPLNKIESQIESTKNKRKTNKSEAYELGLKLFVNCKYDLASLKTLLGPDDLQYKLIADDLAKEVMQCGIDYFQEWKESKNPSDEGLKLLKYAQSIAVGSQTKDRIKENIEGMQEWAEIAHIKDDLNFITSKLENFQNTSHSIDNAKTLISSCKVKLQNIKNILGSSNELYLSISSALVGNALGMIIEVVNKAQRGIEYNKANLLLLLSTVSNAVSAINLMDSFDMNSQTRRRFLNNKATILNINTQLDSVRKQIVSETTKPPGNGCYLATMAYGDYDHPQVIELRKFRDEYLDKTLIGRGFIRLYYKFSPLLVEKLKNKPRTNILIRKLLDKFIKTIRK